MDIDLTSSEKKSFFSFLGLYLGSSFILMLIALFFYYQNEKTLYLDLVKSNMQNIVSKVSNEIIISHMLDVEFDKNIYLKNQDYKISFYDKDKNLLFGNLNEKLNFEQNFYNDEEKLIIVDSSTVGHLGIWYIALKDNSLKEKISNLDDLLSDKNSAYLWYATYEQSLKEINEAEYEYSLALNCEKSTVFD